jgi:hypothetical protein
MVTCFPNGDAVTTAKSFDGEAQANLPDDASQSIEPVVQIGEPSLPAG